MQNGVDKFLSDLVGKGIIKKYSVEHFSDGPPDNPNWVSAKLVPSDGKCIEMSYSIPEHGAVLYMKRHLKECGYLTCSN